MGTPAMKNSFLSAIVLTFSIFALSFLVPSRACASNVKKAAAKDTTYMVVKVGNKYKVISASGYKAEEKRVKDDNEQKLKEWHDLKLTDPTAPPPQKVSLTKIKAGYQTQSKAQEYADKLTEDELTKDDQKPKEDTRK
jgi:hypothetical protein